MKKLFFICSILVAAVAAKAQLPSVVEMGQDSIRITRGEFVLRNSSKDVKGFLYNTGGGVTIFKRIEQLNDSTWIFGADTLHFNASVDPGGEGSTNVTASRGLHKNGTDIRWGNSTLDSVVDIDQDGNGIVFHDGIFAHGTGDYTGFTGSYSILQDQDQSFFSIRSDGDLIMSFTNTLNSGGQLQLQANRPSASNVSYLVVSPETITLDNADGDVRMPQLVNLTKPNVVYYNVLDGKLSYGAAPSGSGSVTADRGLHVSGSSNVRWGGSDLDSAVVINQDGNGITFHDGMFLHGTGDYLAQTNPYSLLSSFNDQILWKLVDGSDDVGFEGGLSSKQLNLHAISGSATSIFNINAETGFTLDQDNGLVFVPNLVDSVQEYILYTNLSNGKITRGAAPVGGVGDDLTEITADNGLTASTVSNVQLGGTSPGSGDLLHTTYIDFNSFQLNLSGSVASGGLSVTNTHATASAAIFTGGTSAAGITTSGGQYGINATSPSGAGVRGGSTNGIGGSFISEVLPLQVQRSGALTNTSGQLAELSMFSTGTPAAGFGGHLGFYLKDNGGGSTAWGSGRIGTKWIDPIHATRSSQMEFFNTETAVERMVMAIAPSGQLKLPFYITTTFDDVPTKALGVDADGNVVTFEPCATGGGSSDPLVFDPTYFDGDGSVGAEITLKTDVVALQTDILAAKNRIDSIVNNWPVGGAAGKTWVQNAGGSGDTLSFRVNDSLFSVKRLVAGANVTFTVGANSITINGTGGSAEVNTLSVTLSGTGTLTITAEAILEYVLVNPTTTLANFNVGTVADADYYLPGGISVPATALAHELEIKRYIPSSTAIQFSGVTSSTEIDLIFKPIHR